MEVSKIFRDSEYPEITYVERRNGDKENKLADYLFKESGVVSISGPSKTGKSALLKHVINNKEVAPDIMVDVRGNKITESEDFWATVLKEMGEPTTREYTNKSGTKSKSGFSIGAAVQMITGKYHSSETDVEFDTIVEKHDLGLNTVLEIFVDDDTGELRDFVIFVDDAHKIPDSAYENTAESIKEGVDKGFNFCTGYIDYRSDALTSYDIDLSSRVESIKLESWDTDELMEIAHKGFDELDTDVSDETIEILANESIQSPQIMQKLCYELCTENNIYHSTRSNKKIDESEDAIRDILRSVGNSLSELYSTELDILSGAAKGRSDKQFNWVDGNSGDRYDTVLRGIASTPAQLSYELESLKHKIYEQCEEEAPDSGNITSDIKNRMSVWIDESNRSEDFVFDYVEDREKEVQIPEPALVFSIRWSDVIEYEPTLHR